MFVAGWHWRVAPPEKTLAEVIGRDLGNGNPPLGKAVRFGPLSFRVLRLAGDGRIEMVGMSILPEEEEIQTDPRESAT